MLYGDRSSLRDIGWLTWLICIIRWVSSSLPNKLLFVRPFAFFGILIWSLFTVVGCIQRCLKPLFRVWRKAWFGITYRSAYDGIPSLRRYWGYQLALERQLIFWQTKFNYWPHWNISAACTWKYAIAVLPKWSLKCAVITKVESTAAQKIFAVSFECTYLHGIRLRFQTWLPLLGREPWKVCSYNVPRFRNEKARERHQSRRTVAADVKTNVISGQTGPLPTSLDARNQYVERLRVYSQFCVIMSHWRARYLPEWSRLRGIITRDESISVWFEIQRSWPVEARPWSPAERSICSARLAYRVVMQWMAGS